MATYVPNNAIEDDLQVARSGGHLPSPLTPIIGFRNKRFSYGNACYRNAVVSVLVNLVPFAGWMRIIDHAHFDQPTVVSLFSALVDAYFAQPAPGKQDSIDTAIQKLVDHINIRPKWPPDGENGKSRYLGALPRPRTLDVRDDVRNPQDDPAHPQNAVWLAEYRFLPERQQDAADFLHFLCADAYEQLRRMNTQDHDAESFSWLIQSEIVSHFKCRTPGCKEESFDDPAFWSHPITLKVKLDEDITTFDELLWTDLGLITLKECRRCKKVVEMDETKKILRPAEILFIEIDQLQGQLVKENIKVPEIPDRIDLHDFLEEDTKRNNVTAKYRLAGCVHHAGENFNLGHYVSHVQRGETWYKLDDSRTSASSLAILQAYNEKRGASQPFPRLLAYVRDVETRTQSEDEGEDISAIPAALPEFTAAGLEPTTADYIEYFETHGIPTKGAKKVEILKKQLDRFRQPKIESDYSKRTTRWLLDQLVKLGVILELKNPTKTQLAGLLNENLAIRQQEHGDSALIHEQIRREETAAAEREEEGEAAATEEDAVVVKQERIATPSQGDDVQADRVIRMAEAALRNMQEDGLARSQWDPHRLEEGSEDQLKRVNEAQEAAANVRRVPEMAPAATLSVTVSMPNHKDRFGRPYSRLFHIPLTEYNPTSRLPVRITLGLTMPAGRQIPCEVNMGPTKEYEFQAARSVERLPRKRPARGSDDIEDESEENQANKRRKIALEQARKKLETEKVLEEDKHGRRSGSAPRVLKLRGPKQKREQSRNRSG